MSNLSHVKQFSFSQQKLDNEKSDIIVPFLHTSDKDNKSDGRISSQKSLKDGIGTPGFPLNPWRGLSSPNSKEPRSRELDSLSQNIQKFTAKLDSISLPDRIQLVKRTRIGRRGQVKLGFDINSMDQSLSLEESLFNHDEFSIDFGGLDLLEFSFKKADGIKVRSKSSKSDITVDHEALEKFNYKNFAIALNVEGDLRRIGYINKQNGVYLMMNLEEKVLYKIQKIEPNNNASCQKVFILNEKEDVVGGLDLIHLGTNTLACTVLFPPMISNIDKLLIIGTVFILMWKISPSKAWMNQLNPSRSSYIYLFFRKIFNRLCPRH